MTSILLPLALVFGVPVAGIIALLIYELNYARNSKVPLTGLESLKELPPHPAPTAGRPRLSRRGTTLAFMSSAFGFVGCGISWAIFHNIARNGFDVAAVPAVIAILLFDCVFLVFAAMLAWDYFLVANGRFSVGVVVAARVGVIYSWDIIYDFVDHEGCVVRGGSPRRVFTADRSDFGVGSHVPIVYLSESSSRNSLYISLAWIV